MAATSIFHSKPIHKDTWLIQGDGSNSYLLVGDAFGLVIDTGFAVENIQEYAQSLTDIPVTMTANTHGHFDHTGGNGWFSQVYMSAKALEIAKTPYPSKAALPYPLDYPVTIIGEGDSIDLGGRSLEAIEIPAHAPSSIAFLDRKERILFTGDEVANSVMLVWMQDEPQRTIEQHARNMEKLLQYRDAFDFICSGHSNVMGDPGIIEVFLEHDRRIMAGIEGELWESIDKYPADFHMTQPEFKRESEYKGTRIGYDSRYVFDKASIRAS